MLTIPFEKLRWQGKEIDGLLIFLGSAAFDAASIDSTFSRWAEKNVVPLHIFILGSKESVVGDAIRYKDNTPQVLDRLRVQANLSILHFDNTGKILLNDLVATENGANTLFYQILDQFIANQILENEVVVPAPSGIYFRKTSGRLSSHFIRAEALLESTAAIEAYALRLLMPFADYLRGVSSTDQDIQIYIDSMAIWPIADKLRQFHSNTSSNRNYSIISFGSYDGFSAWNPPQTKSSFVLISASTSDSLARQVLTKVSLNRQAVWTILSLEPSSNPRRSDENRGCESVYVLPRKLSGRSALDGLRPNFDPDLKVEGDEVETIQIIGERFLAQAARPKRVRLTHASIEVKVKNQLSLFADHKIVRIKKGQFDRHNIWPISFDLEGLFRLFFEPVPGEKRSSADRFLSDNLSFLPTLIIYALPSGTPPPDVAKKYREFAERIERKIKSKNSAAIVYVRSSAELEVFAENADQLGFPMSDCCVVVAAPIISGGFTFKSIAASLRTLQPVGPRLFLCIAALPTTLEQYNRLKADVAYQNHDGKYSLISQFVIPIGAIKGTSLWNEELAHFRKKNLDLCPVLDARLNLIQSQDSFESNSVFLPSSIGNSLSLTAGTLLWDSSAAHSGTDLAGEVFLAVAHLLQATREKTSLPSSTSLRSSVFQHALLCPFTFTRFNDPVIQAAILRLARVSELDYRVLPEASKDMKTLLLKWIDNHDKTVGGAVPEFLLAIGLGKLQLAKNDLDEVIEMASAKLINNWVSEVIL